MNFRFGNSKWGCNFTINWKPFSAELISLVPDSRSVKKFWVVKLTFEMSMSGFFRASVIAAILVALTTTLDARPQNSLAMQMASQSLHKPLHKVMKLNLAKSAFVGSLKFQTSVLFSIIFSRIFRCTVPEVETVPGTGIWALVQELAWKFGRVGTDDMDWELEQIMGGVLVDLG